MIVQIRGTSGSGKSTAVRRIMNNFKTWESQFISGRKKPLYYRNGRGLIVLGHYESPCGGCDTIGSAAAVYDLITNLLNRFQENTTILCEGLLLSEDVKWSSQLPDLRILYLTTPIDTCLNQIQQRRSEAGNNKPLNTSNTTNRVAVIERSRIKLSERGILCRRCTSDQAVSIVTNWIQGKK